MSTLTRKFLRTFFCLIPAIGTAHADQAALVGDWFMEGTEHGNFTQFIYHRDANGTFSVQIRVLDHCQPKYGQIESGTWALVDDKLDQFMTAVNGYKTNYHDIFSIQSPIGDTYTSYDPETGITWQSLKVPGDFTFPDPKSCAIS